MKNTAEGGIRAVVVATGIASVAVQLVVVREYLAQFQGNEIVIALIFFCWLVFGGVGSAAARGVNRRGRISVDALITISCLLAVFAVLQVVAIRRLRDLLFVHGASVGFYPTLGFIAVTSLPYTFLIGFVLPYSLAVVRQWSPRYPGNRIYMADNVGDVAGGALFSFALVHWITPLQVLLAVHLPLLISLGALPRASTRRTATGVAVAVLVLAAAAAFEHRLLPHREGRRVAYMESRYGRIEVVDAEGHISIYTDGVPAVAAYDPALAEEAVHFPLAQVPHPRRLLLISAVGGVLEEIAKYHPTVVDYVELDPLVARAQIQFGVLDPIFGLKLIAQDARTFLARTDNRYDAILVNLPEPETFQTNRFFTAEFFALVKRRLAPGGVFSFGVEGVANYVSAQRAQRLSALANTATAVFENVQLIPGQRIFFVCRDGPIRTDIPDLLAQKAIETEHIRRFYSGDVSNARIRQLNARIDKKVPMNRDLSPQLMRFAFRGWFQRHGESPRWSIGVLALLFVTILFTLSRTQWVLLTTGCVSIGSEMVAIFAFQAFYGYIYMQIGVLVTVFLAGLLPGAWAGGRYRGDPKRALMAGDIILILILASFAVFLAFTSPALPAASLYLFGILVSFCCGFQFPMALKVSRDRTTAAAGYFSADLVGAALGVLLVSLILIPFFGLLWSTWCLAGIKLISLMVAGSIHANA